MDVEPNPKQRVVAEYTPYFNKDEFIEVYSCLYSQIPIEIEKGIRRISFWECRAQPALPLGVAASSAIINAIFREDIAKSNVYPAFANQEDFRLMYSSALTRFVNLVCQMAYVPGTKKITHREAAKKFNIPEWLIDLRHEATHKKMPTLKLLRSAAHVARLWLQKNYWEPEINSFKDFVQVARFSRLDIENTLAAYLHLRFEEMHEDLSQAKLMTVKSELTEVWKKMKKQAMENHKAFFEALISPGVFLHSMNGLESILGTEDAYMADFSQGLPDALLEFWLPMILMICDINLLQEFLETLFESQNQPLDAHKHLVTEWCNYFIDTDMLYRTELQDVPEDHRIGFNWIRLLVACMRYPNKRTPPLVEKIMQNIKSLGDNTKGLFLGLVSIYTGLTVPEVSSVKHSKTASAKESRTRTSSSDNPSSPPLKRGRYTEKDYQRALKKWKNFPNDTIQIAEDDIDWASIPLGEVFNPEPRIALVETDPKSECCPQTAKSLPVVDNQASAQSVPHVDRPVENGDIPDEEASMCQIGQVFSTQYEYSDEDDGPGHYVRYPSTL